MKKYGRHIHLDNYQGGLNDETAEQKKALVAQNQRSGGEYMKGDGGNNHYGGGSTPQMHFFAVFGSIVKIIPLISTFCEPVYPDLIYVAGNIPNSVVEKAVEKNNTTNTDTDNNNSKGDNTNKNGVLVGFSGGLVGGGQTTHLLISHVHSLVAPQLPSGSFPHVLRVRVQAAIF